jgi:hypothetical protein
MKYSDKLNGFWEEGYHYYLEFNDEKLTVRDYRRAVAIETTVSYDAAALERGERTVIKLKNNVLSTCWDGSPMSVIKELSYENGELTLLKCYLEDDEKTYTLKRADHGPFDHIIIRDDEFLPKLQGTWKQWNGSGELSIIGRELKWEPFSEAEKFHVISYKYSPDKVKLVPEDLIRSEFRGFTAIDVEKDMLTTYMMVYDMSVPMTVFARANMLDKIEVPGAALREPRNTMIHTSAPLMGFMGMGLGMGMGMGQPTAPARPAAPAQTEGESGSGPKFCPECGYGLRGLSANFCPECGSDLRGPATNYCTDCGYLIRDLTVKFCPECGRKLK